MLCSKSRIHNILGWSSVAACLFLLITLILTMFDSTVVMWVFLGLTISTSVSVIILSIVYLRLKRREREQHEEQEQQEQQE